MKFEVKNLFCQKGGHLLFRNLSFSLSSGQIILFQGDNGVGKSSLLKILAGISFPEKGGVYWNGKNIREQYSHFLSCLGYLSHQTGLKKLLTPVENILYRLALGEGCYHNDVIREVITAFGLEKVQHIPCHLLSEGQKRKVALTAVILLRKKIWILDEPFNSLDKTSIQIMKHFFNEHLNAKGMIIMASHHALEIAHQIVELKLERQ